MVATIRYKLSHPRKQQTSLVDQIMPVVLLLHCPWQGPTSKAQTCHLTTLARKELFPDMIIFQDQIILKTKSIVDLVTCIRVWLDSSLVHLIIQRLRTMLLL